MKNLIISFFKKNLTVVISTALVFLALIFSNPISLVEEKIIENELNSALDIVVLTAQPERLKTQRQLVLNKTLNIIRSAEFDLNDDENFIDFPTVKSTNMTEEQFADKYFKEVLAQKNSSFLTYEMKNELEKWEVVRNNFLNGYSLIKSQHIEFIQYADSISNLPTIEQIKKLDILLNGCSYDVECNKAGLLDIIEVVNNQLVNGTTTRVKAMAMVDKQLDDTPSQMYAQLDLAAPVFHYYDEVKFISQFNAEKFINKIDNANSSNAAYYIILSLFITIALKFFNTFKESS